MKKSILITVTALLLLISINSCKKKSIAPEELKTTVKTYVGLHFRYVTNQDTGNTYVTVNNKYTPYTENMEVHLLDTLTMSGYVSIQSPSDSIYFDYYINDVLKRHVSSYKSGWISYVVK
jgi:hypothetical protein